MHDALDICLAAALVMLAGAEALNIQPLAFLGGFFAGFHLLFHVSVAGKLIYNRKVRK